MAVLSSAEIQKCALLSATKNRIRSFMEDNPFPKNYQPCCFNGKQECHKPTPDEWTNFRLKGYQFLKDALETINMCGKDFGKQYPHAHDILIRPLYNIIRLHTESDWGSFTISDKFNVDESGEPGLGFLHLCFQSILQHTSDDYKDNKLYLECIKKIIQDLHLLYIDGKILPPNQGEVLPICSISKRRSIILTVPPSRELLAYWQLQATFISISKIYVDWPAYWPLLGHEVGGHEIINGYYDVESGDHLVVNDLLDAVSEKLFQGNGSKPYETQEIDNKASAKSQQVSVAFDTFALDYWTDQAIFQESLASILGYMNIGPSYGIALYCVTKPLLDLYYKTNFSSMRECDLYSGRYRYGVHPMGVLHMRIGMECMKYLGVKFGGTFNEWAKVFEDLSCPEDENVLILSSNIDLDTRKIVISFRDMSCAISRLVDIVLNTKISSLKSADGDDTKSFSISDFELWNSDDEKKTMALADELAKDKKQNWKSRQLEGMTARYAAAAATIASAKAHTEDAISSINSNALDLISSLPDDYEKRQEKRISRQRMSHRQNIVGRGITPVTFHRRFRHPRFYSTRLI